jgi:hypothetical protein
MMSEYADDAYYYGPNTSEPAAWPVEDTNQEQLNVRDTVWPKESDPEWYLPDTRQPYHHFTNLRMSGRRERLTSTYTEDLGTVRPGEIADINPPLSGLQPWGAPLLHTEYDDKFSAVHLRPPGYHQPAPHQGNKLLQLTMRIAKYMSSVILSTLNRF